MFAAESGNKPFDRQFVAEQLKKLLSCPKCHSEYNHKSTNGEENHRPFLLPCGHNQCEKCLVDHIVNDKEPQCAICLKSALPTISAQALQASTGLPYQLDYHVMGVLADLENIRRSSTVNLLQVSEIRGIAPVVKAKCCECIASVATRDCKQCNALYCKACYEMVHHNSRVLKAHAFKSLREPIDAHNRMRVGNDDFTMPFQRSCKHHHTPFNTYCRQCKITICGKCVDRMHAGHPVQLLSDINLRMASEIPACKLSLESALRNIHNGQAVVHAANAKQTGYAEEMLGHITQRFGHLHGLLQMSEMQLIEKLRESSMPAQMEFKRGLDKLNGYEAVISRLLGMLLPSGADVPKDVWLKELLRLCSENLEKIPSSVKVCKVDGNPYRLTTCGTNEASKLREILCQLIMYDYIDPCIRVRFQTEFDCQDNSSLSSENGEISLLQSSSSGKENMSQRQAVIQPRMRVENPNSQEQDLDLNQNQKRQPNIDFRVAQQRKLNSNEEICEKIDGQPVDKELERTFSAMDISTNPKETKGEGPIRPNDWFKSDVLVLVLAIKSPEDFYVQGVNAALQLRKKLDSYIPMLPPNPTSIVVGQHYIAYQNDQKLFHRVLVRQKLAEMSDTYDVFLPDVGMNIKMHSSNIHELPHPLTLIPYAAVHCSLSELKPRELEWNAVASFFFKMVLKNRPAHLIVKRPGRTHRQVHHQVDLITESNISVREAFLYSGLARSRGTTVTALKHLAAPKAKRMPKAKHQVGDVRMIQMLHVAHPQEFYLMRHDFESKRSELDDFLKSTMDRMYPADLEHIFVGRLQMGCAMQLNDRWVRVCIENLLRDGYVMVRLVDFGSTQKVFWDQLFALPKQFMQSELSIKCCLADVEPLQANDYLWTPEAIASFKQLISNPKIQMEVIRVQEDVHHVALDIIRSGSEPISVGAQLVALEHCTPSGESSRKANLFAPNTRSLDEEMRKFLEIQKGKATVPSSPSQPDKYHRKQVLVDLLHVRHPNEFYVTLPSFKPSILKLQEAVQEEAGYRYENNPIKFDWKEGDLCYVKVRAQGDSTELWHRGVVTHVLPGTCELSLPLYEVQLRDLGELVQDVMNVNLASISEEQQLIASSALRCQLHGLRPKNDQWTADDVDFFKDQLKAYDQLYSVSHGKDGQTLSVVLYGSHTVVKGPFAPARTKYVNINETLVLARVAIKDPEQDYQDDKSTETDESSEAEQSPTDDVEYLKSVQQKSPEVKPAFEHCDGMPPMKLLWDLGMSTPTTGQMMPPLGWRTPRPCEKSIFTGMVTNVNYDCDLYMTLATDKPFMGHMSDLLEKHYAPIKERRGSTTATYVPGQPVLVTYHLNGLLYRGIVQSPKNAKGEYSVFFVDYGNIEEATAEELLPFAPFPNLNALCWLVTIHGVRPNCGKYTIKEMDTVHKWVVMKVCTVNVHERNGPNKLPSCQIKLDSGDLATMMLNCRIAVSAVTQSKEKSISIPNPTLDEFKVFDELETLASGSQMKAVKTRSVERVNDKANSTDQAPPVKKKYYVQNTNEQCFTFPQRVDCRQAADKPFLISGGRDFDKFDFEDGMNVEPSCLQDASMESEDDVMKSCLSEDVVVYDDNEKKDIVDEDDDDKENESIVFGDDNKESRTVVDKNANQVKPDFVVAHEQLLRRIELRFKEMVDNASFAPLDTSTVRSIYGNKGAFKSLIIPHGVETFQCTVDSLISATEVQITPALCDFTKREISLIQETSGLINKAAPLHPMQNALCLARYSKDDGWYRATIKEIHKSTKEATVYYIDFHDTETVSYAHLKEMPEELFMFPLRSCRVKLHGVKMNKKFGEKTVYQALQACLCKSPMAYARVHHPSNNRASKGERAETVTDSSSDSTITEGHNPIEVDLFEDRHMKRRLYEPLIENWMFLKK